MTTKPSLFEHLARRVDGQDRGSTQVTGASETFDDDNSASSIGVPLEATTMETKQDRDTYDDNRMLFGLSVPGGWESMTTTFTRTDSETFDDDNFHSLGIPRC